LPTKLLALTYPPSLLVNQERLWTFDLDKSQVRGRYNCIREIRRSHCQPFCVYMFAQLEWAHLHPLDQEKIALSRYSVSCVSVFGTGGLSIPTIWWLDPGFYIPSGKGVLALPWGNVSCCLIAVALRFGWGRQLSRSANELGLQNFLTTRVKELWRQRLQRPRKFCAQTKTRNMMGLTK
jgi:hypothetical protein